MKKDNILIIAYACEPNASSEPGVGWNFVKEISKDSNVWVVTRSNNREIIEKENNLTKNDNVNWVYVDLSYRFRWLKKNMPLGIQFYYMLWQWKVFFRCRKLIEEVDFKLVHHLTFGVTWLAPIACLLKPPFIWGPIGGGDTVPVGYLLKERFPAIAQELLYFTLTKVVCRISLLNYIARNRAKFILFRSKSVDAQFPKTNIHSRCVISETATSDIKSVLTIKPKEINAICVGRHQYWKGYRYAVEGFCKYLANGGTGTLHMFGDGPESAMLKDIHRSYGSPVEVKFHGNVSHDKVLEALETATVLIHPSFRDGGSWSVIEALSHSVPVIAQNASGTADIVTEDCGILVDTQDVELSDGIANALKTIANNDSLIEKLSSGAIERIQCNYTWEKRAQDLKAIYSKIP